MSDWLDVPFDELTGCFSCGFPRIDEYDGMRRSDGADTYELD
jgi:hypothetical protein